MIEFKVVPNRFTMESQIPILMAHETDHLTIKAKAVMTLLERWGMVQGYDDGEDKRGRAKLALMPAEETVARAFKMVDAAFAELESRGWIVQSPSLAEIDQEVTREGEKEV